eukprot:6912366-Ditylum_brightwellii.AAC.1
MGLSCPGQKVVEVVMACLCRVRACQHRRQPAMTGRVPEPLVAHNVVAVLLQSLRQCSWGLHAGALELDLS